METLMLSASDPKTAGIAADIIKNGGLVAIPTETVYGLGANGLDENAVAKIFEAKGRPQDNPLILHVADAGDIEKLCHSIPGSAYKLAEAVWPGPLTMVLPARDIVPKRTTGGLSTVAGRCPDCAVTREIIRASGVPIAAPSANISGKPSTTTAEHVLHDHNGKIPAIVDGGACRVGVESTIVDLTDETPRLLRPGGITPQAMADILGDILIDKAVTGSVDGDAVVKAPGMKYRHYAPACKVVIVDGDLPAATAYIRKHFVPGNRVLCFEEELEAFADFAPLAYGREKDPDSLMAGLFAALRKIDDPEIGKVFARCPRGAGKNLAVQNRLQKAAGFTVIQARQKNLVVGITGGSGCGKTTLLELIREQGGVVFDCDEIYHQLLEQSKAMNDAIENRFPSAFENGKLHRKKLGEIVFSDPDALADLNKITHAAVKKELLRRFPASPSLIAIDAIGLFEGELDALCDVTVAVTAPLEDRIARLISRDGISEEYARKRIGAQHNDGWFATHCDHVLVNDGNLDAFATKCLAFLHHIAIIEEKP